jgi:hypothetical protein
MGNPSKLNKALVLRCIELVAIIAAIASIVHMRAHAQARPGKRDSAISVHYKDVRQQAGITFKQDSTQTEEKYYLETMGTGVGWIDYDQDGLMDLFFVQSAATDIYKPAQPLRSVLYRNNGDGTFTDTTEKAGLAGEGHYGQGVTVGDFDNDGYPDIYAHFFTITTETAPSPMSLPKPALRMKVVGQPAQVGSITTKMDGSTWWSPITSSGRQKTTSGVANTARATVLTVIPETTKDSG